MSTTSARGAYEDSTKGQWATGIAGFAGIMLVVVAGLEILEGLAAIANDAVYVTGINYTYEFDVTAWGWTHVILGAIAVIVGIAIIKDQTWGMIAGIAIAFISTLTNFAFIPYYPIWSFLVVAFNVIVIWALCSRIFNEVPEPPAGYPSDAGTYGTSGSMSGADFERQRMSPPHFG